MSINPSKFRLCFIAGIQISFLLFLMLMSGCTNRFSENEFEKSPSPALQTEEIPAPPAETSAPPIETPLPPEPTPEPTASLISQGFEMTINNIDISKFLYDGDVYSKVYITPSRTLYIESESPFSSFYIEWWQPPENCTINWENGQIEGSKQSPLHEYIKLPEAVNSISIEAGAVNGNAICTLELFTEGKAPDTVQDWLPPYETADILVFPTHSDDDALFFGPLISYYTIEKDLKVQTAFMVNHTSNPMRAHERLNGLWEMGVENYPILGDARDTETHSFEMAMSIYEEYNIDEWQAEQIRRFRPLVVVGHDLDGEYGNAGHKVNAYHLVNSIEDAANPEKFPESAELYGVWNCPKLYLHLYENNQIFLDVNTALSRDISGRTAFEIAEDAFKHHTSQQGLGFYVAQEDNPEYDCRLFGLYRSLVGPDTENDIMENVSDELRK